MEPDSLMEVSGQDFKNIYIQFKVLFASYSHILHAKDKRFTAES